MLSTDMNVDIKATRTRPPPRPCPHGVLTSLTARKVWKPKIQIAYQASERHPMSEANLC